MRLFSSIPSKHSILSSCAVTLLAAIVLIGNTALAENFEQQRRLFQDASFALKKNQVTKFKRLLNQLDTYPAVAYLYHDAFRRVIHRAKAKDVTEFLKRYEDYPFNYHLRSKWLSVLAARKDWANYLLFFDNRDNSRYQCLAFQARLKLGLVENINDDIKKVWLRGYSQPSECDIAFEHLLNTYPDREEIVWVRIEKAFAARRPNLAKYLGKKLNEKDRAIVDLWYQAHRRPEKSLKKLAKLDDSRLNQKIVTHALDRLARKDSLKAKVALEKFEKTFSIETSDTFKLQQRIALSAAYQHEPEAKELLLKLPEEAKNDQVHLWLARMYLRNQEWDKLANTIGNMPTHLSDENEWQYWLARSIETSGQEINSEKILRSLSRKSSYYGFLAADKLKVGYRIEQENAASIADFDAKTLLQENEYLMRARELFFVGRLVDAKREWFQALRKMNPEQIKQAATLASVWKWHDSAIRTVAKTPHRSDYSLRFPMPYKKQVLHHASTKQLDPSVIYGVMRRESLFDPFAKSGVGALGLMQLMPATARHVAKSLGLKRPRQADILNIDYNIKLGTQYFRTVMNRFDGNVSLAAAAYNAGPRNVKRWLPKDNSLPADLWVETVPFKETRNYVQAVLAYSTVFDKSLGQNILMSSRMGDVQPRY